MDILEDKKIITERYFSLINYNNVELYGKIKDSLDAVQPILPMIDFVISRLCTVTELTMNGSLWDAEIVYRSALETFVKLVFITSSEGEEQKIRIREFWEDLAEINRIKQSEQAKKNLMGYGHLELYRLSYSPLVLSDEEETRLKGKWPKALRQKVEQKWSFSEIIANFAKGPKGPNPLVWGLAHNYRMASHVMHGDETGILIIKEREQRPAEEREAAEFAHYLRLLSDSLSFCVGTSLETMVFLKKDLKFFLKIFDGVKDLEPLVDSYQMRVYNDPSYDKFKQQSS